MEQAGRLQDELLREELQDAETREILERLSFNDLGGSELSTIAAVSEATGASPEVIGRMLADIRQDDLDQRFGQMLRKHEAQIGQHGKRLDRHDSEIERFKRAAPRASTYGDEVDEELVRMAEERIRERQTAPAYIILALAVVFIFLVIVSNSRPKPDSFNSVPPQIVTPVHVGPDTYTKTMPNGDRIAVERGGKAYVRESNGTIRPPNDSEKATVAGMRAELNSASNRVNKP